MTRLPGSRSKWIALGLFAVYLIALFLPAVHIRRWAGVHPGSDGWVHMWIYPMGLPLPVWNANPIFLLGLIFLALGKRRIAFYSGLVALLLALVTTFFVQPSGPETRSFGAGYYVWITCMFGLVATIRLAPVTAKAKDEPPSSADQQPAD